MTPQPIKHVLDATAGGITLATLLSWIPSITAVLALIWWAIRIYETATVQSLIERFRRK